MNAATKTETTFARRVSGRDGPLRAEGARTLQINVGRRCNQACRHCHVDAGPERTEAMSDEIVDACLSVLARHASLETLDVTGGAPELHARFRDIVRRARALSRAVIVRHNLTVQTEPGQGDLPAFFAEQEVEVVCSLPHYLPETTDRQRGRGVFDKSITALRALNAAGYGREGGLVLTLVSNPVGAFLPPRQEDLERDTREHLRRAFGIEFDRLLTITNMPIARFADWLHRAELYDEYMSRLREAYNADTVPGLMCRHLVSVGYDGRLFDCDFNQMLALPLAPGRPRTIRELDVRDLDARPIVTGEHCYGCTAGAGSSCGGSLA